MKKYLSVAASLILIVGISCSSPAEERSTNSLLEKSATSETVGKSPEPTKVVAINGQKLFSDKGCVVCHQLNSKVVGPSVKDIAAAYSGNKAGLTAFLKGEGEAIVDPSQAAVMQTQISITQGLPAVDLDAMVDYILSTK